MYLQPIQQTAIKGKVSYHESTQAWSVIKLKKELVNQLPYLKEKQGQFHYELNLLYSYDSLEKEIKKLKKAKHPLPMLFWIKKAS
ncbi:MAG: hypothetical protein ABIJ18_02850 [archaeon]